MTNNDKEKTDIDKKQETRSKEISKMIAEGGLGAHSHYYYAEKSNDKKAETIDNFSNDSSSKKEARSIEISRMIAEGGLGAHSHYYYDDKNKK